MAQLDRQAQQKKNQNVIEAGRGAYRMVISVAGNPHSKQPFKDLWDKGWRLERRKEDTKRYPGVVFTSFRKPGQPAITGNIDKSAQDRSTRYPRRPDHSSTGRIDSSRPNQATRPKPAPAAPTAQPAVITDRLISRFNYRHQTRA